MVNKRLGTLWFRSLVVVMITLSFTACGGGGDDGGGTTETRIGGSIQGTPLLLTGEVATLAGTPISQGSIDGVGSTARFSNPYSIATDGTNLFVADTGNHTIRKVVIATGEVTTLAGTAGADGATDGTGATASFSDPQGITTDGTNLFVADTYNQTIRKVVIATGEVTTLAGTAGFYGAADGTGAAAVFHNPRGITTDGTNLFVADMSNQTIRKVVIATGEVTTLAGSTQSYGFFDGTGAEAKFHNPSGITTDGRNLFVADSYNHTIRKVVIATGEVTTIAGTAGWFGDTDGTGISAKFYQPEGITTDGTNLFVADTDNLTIRKVVIATGQVTTIAGAAGWFGATDGTGSSASFSLIYNLTTDGTNLYVADTNNQTIRKVVIANGEVTTFAGAAGSPGYTDGTGSAARFSDPNTITTDGTNLFVADSDAGTIRKVVIATSQVTTIAGGIYTTSSLTTDGTNLFIGDKYDRIIRKLVIATGEMTTIAAFSYDQTSITTDGTNLFVANTGTRSISKIVIATGVATPVASGFSGQFSLTTDGVNLFVADTGNQTIRKVVIATGEVTTLAGTAGLSGFVDNTGAAARFWNPCSITTDGTNLFVGETGNQTIRKVVIATGEVTTVAGTAPVAGAANGTGPAARFNSPSGITTDGKRLFVADEKNCMIRVIN